jgi:DNA-directed RNA polymerase specialized sigma24 family protein
VGRFVLFIERRDEACAQKLISEVASRRLGIFLSMAFLVLLENLTPVERAVFLLREVYDYEYHPSTLLIRSA